MDKRLSCCAVATQPDPLPVPHLPRLKCPRWICLVLLLAPSPLYAQGTAGDPWDNAVQVLQAAFTSTIARGLSWSPSWSAV